MASARTALIVVLAWQAAAAAAPALSRIEPPAGRRGTEVELTITGAELDDPHELVFEEGRLTARGLASAKENVVTATVVIPADCPLGPQRLRVRTATGLSELRLFHVHGSEQAAEKEPNNEPANATLVAPGTAVWGRLGSEDVDIFSIRLAAGQRIAAAIEGIALGQHMIDPRIELVDPAGNTVAACDDHPLMAQDAALAATAGTEGTYHLRVRDVAFAGGNGTYLLHVGDVPIPHVAWPPGGSAGTTFDVDWLGDPAGPFRGPVTPAGPGLDRLCRVRPTRAGVAGPIGVPFRVTAAPVVIETDTGNDPEQAVQAPAPCGVAGRLGAADDVDWFRVAAPKGSKWKVTAWGRRLGSPVDLVIAAHRDDRGRQQLAGNDDAEGPDSMLQVTVPDEGAFLLRVGDFQRRGGDAFVYWIDVEPLAPRIMVSVPPAQTKTQQRLVAAVPRGNRTALVFNATRTECADPVTLDVAGLPAGVTAAAGAFEPPAPGGLVVFEAAADAPCSTALAEVRVVRGGPEAASPVGGLLQETELVHGEPNNHPYRSAWGDRLAVAVVEEAPVVLEVAAPPGPLVRRGAIDLKVSVRRSADFTGRVRLELPFKPPGVSAALVEVKEGETEVLFPLNAAADAPAKDWQIAVAASLVPDAATKKEAGKAARAGRGMWISTRPVSVSVIEPLVELAADKGQVEQGGRTSLVFRVTKAVPFTGRARVTLGGLPDKVTAGTVEMEAGTTSFEVPVTAAEDAPAGKHDSVFCRVEVPRGDAWVIHKSAATSLRISKPRLAAPAAARGKEGGS